MYPRLYPYLSPQMDRVLGNRLDLVDTTCTFVFVFIALTGVTSPLLGRMDGWSAFPLGFLVLAGVSYRGARRTAERYLVSLCTAFDLHRFDMLRALHRTLPRSPETELIENQELSDFLAQDGLWPKDISRAYDHGDQRVRTISGLTPRRRRNP